jgi:hypothetical protein
MRQAGYIEPMFFKEEIREHRQQDLSLLMARQQQSESANSLTTSSSHLQNRKSPKFPLIVQSVTIESEDQRMDRKRKTKEVKIVRYGKIIGLLFGVVVLLDVLDDLLSPSNSVNRSPVIIQRDYSTLRSIDDLTTDSVDVWCYVSTLMGGVFDIVCFKTVLTKVWFIGRPFELQVQGSVTKWRSRSLAILESYSQHECRRSSSQVGGYRCFVSWRFHHRGLEGNFFGPPGSEGKRRRKSISQILFERCR